MISFELQSRSKALFSLSISQHYACILRKVCNLFLCISFLAACSLPLDAPAGRVSSGIPTDSERVETLDEYPSTAEWEALSSLVKVDSYPLYVMKYSPDHTHLGTLDFRDAVTFPSDARVTGIANHWRCSLVSVISDKRIRLFGRNFDWRYSPALLLFYQPADGFRSVSMVDLDYFFIAEEARRLDKISLEDQMPLLDTYRMPFDGMNSQGLAIGMAAVPFSDVPSNPELETVDSLAMIRRILDQAADVESALNILSTITPSWGGGPSLHYLISDSSGRSVLVEYFEGEMIILESAGTWQIATNFLQQSVDITQAGQCWRYDQLNQALQDRSGEITMAQLMELLASVSQGGEGSSTQWSIVYDFSQGDIEVVVGQGYANPYRFNLLISKPQSN
jgi:hypothetical protein